VAASAQAWPPTWFCSTRKYSGHRHQTLSSAQGIDYVIVNGQLAIDQSQPTNALPGKILRTAT
jgi:hypothetical protein